MSQKCLVTWFPPILHIVSSFGESSGSSEVYFLSLHSCAVCRVGAYGESFSKALAKSIYDCVCLSPFLHVICLQYVSEKYCKKIFHRYYFPPNITQCGIKTTNNTLMGYIFESRHYSQVLSNDIELYLEFNCISVTKTPE